MECPPSLWRRSFPLFLRYVEAKRIAEDMEAYRTLHPTHDEYVILGDFNEDIRDAQSFFSPDQSYSWGVNWFIPQDDLFAVYGFNISGNQFSMSLPIQYALFPTHHFVAGGSPIVRVDMHQTGDPHALYTRWPSGRLLDYILVSEALGSEAVGEIYMSDYDGVGVGLPKAGDPPDPEVSFESDHLAVFADVQMIDASDVMPPRGFSASGFPGGPFLDSEQTYVVTSSNTVQTLWLIDVSEPWLSVSQSAIAIGALSSQAVDVWVNAEAHTLLPGLHVGTVTFFNAYSGALYERDVELTVYEPLALSPDTSFQFSGPIGGPFEPPSTTYTVQNNASVAVHWTAQVNADWLTLSSSGGTLSAGQEHVITVGIDPVPASTLEAGSYSGALSISNVVSGNVLSRTISIDVSGDLCIAVDFCATEWTTSETLPWIYQTSETFDGIDAAESFASPPFFQPSWMETIVEGPARVSWHWKVSSLTNEGYMIYRRNGFWETFITGEVDWEEGTVDLPDGTHTLRWEYIKYSSSTGGQDRAWLDQFKVDYLRITSPSTQISGPPGGPFAPDEQIFVLSNAGPTAIEWDLSPSDMLMIGLLTNSFDWLTPGITNGVLEPGTVTNVHFYVNEEAAAKSPGTYFAWLTFSNSTAGTAQQRHPLLQVDDYLIISPDASIPIWAGFSGGFIFTTDQTYTLSNSAPTSLTWQVSLSDDWMSASTTNGTLSPGASTQLTVSLNDLAYQLPAGNYSFSLFFENADTPVIQQRMIVLQTQPSLQAATTNWVITGPVGGPFSSTSSAIVLENKDWHTPQPWQASHASDWLELNSYTGMLNNSTSFELVATLSSDAELLPMGTYTDTVQIVNAKTGDLRMQPVTLQIGLCDALDACELSWTTGGDAPWFAQTAITADGQDAAASGTITHDESSWLETTVTGPGTLSFYWRVSSEAGYDFLEFYIDDIRETRISGEVDWQQRTFAIGVGEHTVRWVYIKDFTVTMGADRGWLDQVRWIPETTERGVPTAWYQQFDLAPAPGATWDSLDDQSAAGNGVPNWVQYVSGLNPTNEASSFRILRMESTPDNRPYLEWWGGTYGPTSHYMIEGKIDDQWQLIGTRTRMNGINSWTGTVSPNVLQQFRIRAEPDP